MFYDRLAELYDEMTGFDGHLDNDMGIFRAVLAEFPAENILDAGCGTGLHSLIFARLGIQATGIDNAPAMIRRARENAERSGLKAKFVRADFLDFPTRIKGNFDAVYCLGNGFVHLEHDTDRLTVLKNFSDVLKPDGVLCIQILNYDRILSQKPGLISDKQGPHHRFIRTYEYQDDQILFRLEVKGLPEPFELIQTLYPLTSREMRLLSEKAGFRRVNLTGSFLFDPFDPKRSPNICAWMFPDHRPASGGPR
jgi:glycine/sarcosine N-methyltransferase